MSGWPSVWPGPTRSPRSISFVTGGARGVSGRGCRPFPAETAPLWRRSLRPRQDQQKGIGVGGRRRCATGGQGCSFYIFVHYQTLIYSSFPLALVEQNLRNGICWKWSKFLLQCQSVCTTTSRRADRQRASVSRWSRRSGIPSTAPLRTEK